MTVREPVEYAFGVALAKASATSGEIRPCERGWRAGERANDRLTRWERKQATLARIAQRERLIGEFLAAAYGPAPLPFTREARHPLDAMPYDITKVN